MSVIIETTLGDITMDLYVRQRPRACLNFLKLCKMKYYNFNLFHVVNRGFIAQTGDPTGTGNGGKSIWGVIEGPSKRYFEAEIAPRIKHTTTGLVSFVGSDENMIGSQFFITLGPDLTYLDEKHCVFGEVVEGMDVLQILDEAICDNNHRPYQDIRITHTVILEDPFPDPEGFTAPDQSPEATADRLQGGRIAPDEEIDETAGKSAKEIEEMIAEREAKARATILEMVGDIPDADIAPPENVLFVCKLNPVTSDDDLEIIFSRFGKIKSCEVIRDKKTGDSLQYAFVEFEDRKACEDAYFKMDNVLIDDRRIHVDFSQSVAKVRWHGKGRGVTHYDDKGNKRLNDPKNDIGKGRYERSNNTERNRSENKYEREKSRNSKSLHEEHSGTDKYKRDYHDQRSNNSSDFMRSRREDNIHKNKSSTQYKYSKSRDESKLPGKYERNSHKTHDEKLAHYRDRDRIDSHRSSKNYNLNSSRHREHHQRDYSHSRGTRRDQDIDRVSSRSIQNKQYTGGKNKQEVETASDSDSSIYDKNKRHLKQTRNKRDVKNSSSIDFNSKNEISKKIKKSKHDSNSSDSSDTENSSDSASSNKKHKKSKTSRSKHRKRRKSSDSALDTTSKSKRKKHK